MQAWRCDIDGVLIIENENLQGKQSGKVKLVQSDWNAPSLGHAKNRASVEYKFVTSHK